MFLRFLSRLRRPIGRHCWVDKLTPEQRAALTQNLKALLQSKTVIERAASQSLHRATPHSSEPHPSESVEPASGSSAFGPNRSPGITR